MTINYNRTGAERKALVNAIAGITGAKAEIAEREAEELRGWPL